MRLFILGFISFFISLNVSAQTCNSIYTSAISLFEKGQYDLALKKLAAYKLCYPDNIAKADSLITRIYKKVNQERIEAIRQRNEAIRQRNIAQANFLLSEAKSNSEDNATLALRLLEAAWKINADSLILKELIRVYRTGSFYKRILEEDSAIYEVSLSPDKKSILIGSSHAALWSVQGELLKEFKGHAAPVMSVAFSPDGSMVLTGSVDGTARLWDLEGRTIKTFKGHNGIITKVAFSYDGRKAITGSSDSTVRVWNLDDNGFLVLKGHSDRITSIAMSPERTILTHSWDKTARLWNPEGKELYTFKNPASASKVIFSPDGSNMLSSFRDTAILYDRNGNVVRKFSNEGDYIQQFAFSPDGKSILTWSRNSNRLFHLNGDIKGKFSNKTDQYIGSIAFSDSGETIIARYQKKIILYTLKGDVLQEFGSPYYHFSYATLIDDENKLLSVSAGFLLQVWGRKGAEKKIQIASASSLAFSPDGKLILIGCYDGRGRLLDLHGNVIREFIGHTKGITSVGFSKSGDMILTGSADSTARIWNIHGSLIKSFKGHSGKVLSVAFSPDEKTILTGSADGTARLWSVTNDSFESFKCNAFVTTVAYSPDNKKILLGTSKSIVWLQDLEKKTSISFKAHTDYVSSVSFSPKGKTILTSSMDGTVCLWSLKASKLMEFGGGGATTHASFSMDGKRILACSGLIASIRDLEGNNLQEFNAFTSPVVTGALSPDGKKVVGAIGGKTLSFWEIAPPVKKFLDSQDIEPLSNKQKKEFGIINTIK